MFREIILHIFRSIRLCVTACGIMHTLCCRPPAGNIVCALYQSCNTQSSAPEDGQNNCSKHVELTGIINKPLSLHLVGCLYYLYQWCTVKQISDNEIYLLIKYIKSVLWRVAKRLSYIEEARCLKVNQMRFHHMYAACFDRYFGHTPVCQYKKHIQNDAIKIPATHWIFIVSSGIRFLYWHTWGWPKYMPKHVAYMWRKELIKINLCCVRLRKYGLFSCELMFDVPSLLSLSHHSSPSYILSIWYIRIEMRVRAPSVRVPMLQWIHHSTTE